MTSRKVARWAAVAAAVLLVAAAVTQLRPFWWDTRGPAHSLEVFGEHRALLMGGALARMFLVFPMTVLGVAMAGLLDGDPLPARMGKALAATAGGLSAVSGAVAVVIGVTEEERLVGPAVVALADVLYWVQDNLLTLSLVAFSAALTAVSSQLWRQEVLPAWGRRAAQVSLLGAGAVPMSFYLGGAEHGSPLYAVPAFGAQAAIMLWLLALAGRLRAGDGHCGRRRRLGAEGPPDEGAPDAT